MIGHPGTLAVLCLMALPAGARAQDAFSCTVTATCTGSDPCTAGDGALRLRIGADGALVTRAEGQEIGFDRPVTRRDTGPVMAFAAVTPLDTTLLLTFDRTSPEGTDSRLMITEHGRDANGARIVSMIATCHPEEG
jgi:hypothetical protein